MLGRAGDRGCRLGIGVGKHADDATLMVVVRGCQRMKIPMRLSYTNEEMQVGTCLGLFVHRLALKGVRRTNAAGIAVEWVVSPRRG